MNNHLLWLWGWFLFGVFVYILKRAYYLVTGPNPVANNYSDFIKRCWIPLFVRFVVDSGFFWLLFYPELLNPLLGMFHIDFQLHSPMSQMPGPVALFVGLGMDAAVDFLVTKIPYLKDWLPQMPGPLASMPPIP